MNFIFDLAFSLALFVLLTSLYIVKYFLFILKDGVSGFFNQNKKGLNTKLFTFYKSITISNNYYKDPIFSINDWLGIKILFKNIESLWEKRYFLK